jgi:hypothetical protein
VSFRGSPGPHRLVAGGRTPPRPPEDLFVFAHGWNNTPAVADRIFRRFFALVAAELAQLPPPRPRAGVLGVVWPSMRWLDEVVPDFPAAETGGAASAAPAGADDPVPALKTVFADPAQQQALERMADLLREQPEDTARLVEFQQLMAVLGVPDADSEAAEDAGEVELVRQDPVDVTERMADAVDAATAPQGDGGGASVGLLAGAPPTDDGTGVADLGNLVSRRWAGAEQALRQFTYFQMKRRAGVVGERGLGPLCADIRAAAPGVRLHLLGHSFGARLVSFALKGVRGGPAPAIASLTMLQGALSHFAFAVRLPFRPDEGGRSRVSRSGSRGPSWSSTRSTTPPWAPCTRRRPWRRETTPPGSRTCSTGGARWATTARRRWTPARSPSSGGPGPLHRWVPGS